MINDKNKLFIDKRNELLNNTELYPEIFKNNIFKGKLDIYNIVLGMTQNYYLMPVILEYYIDEYIDYYFSNYNFNKPDIAKILRESVTIDNDSISTIDIDNVVEYTISQVLSEDFEGNINNKSKKIIKRIILSNFDKNV